MIDPPSIDGNVRFTTVPCINLNLIKNWKIRSLVQLCDLKAPVVLNFHPSIMRKSKFTIILLFMFYFVKNLGDIFVIINNSVTI